MSLELGFMARWFPRGGGPRGFPEPRGSVSFSFRFVERRGLLRDRQALLAAAAAGAVDRQPARAFALVRGVGHVDDARGDGREGLRRLAVGRRLDDGSPLV